MPDKLARFDQFDLMAMNEERLQRATRAMNDSAVPYAVIGGHAVAYWVGRTDPAAIRTTPDINFLLNREDCHAAAEALDGVGFCKHSGEFVVTFIDGPSGNARSGIRIFPTRTRIRQDDLTPTPLLDESIRGESFPVITLEALTRMKLTAFRVVDRMHLIDMASIPLFDERWADRVPEALKERFLDIVHHPEVQENLALQAAWEAMVAAESHSDQHPR